MPCPHGRDAATCPNCLRARANNPGPPVPSRPGPRPPLGPPPLGNNTVAPRGPVPPPRPVGNPNSVQPPPLVTRGVPPPRPLNLPNRGALPIPMGNPMPVQTHAPKPPKIIAGPEQLKAFMADVQSINTSFTRRRSSLLGLLDFLDKNVGAPVPFDGNTSDELVASALAKTSNPRDSRLTRYKPAIKALVKVWGTNNPYKSEPAQAVSNVVISGNRETDLEIAHKVCGELFNIKIIDVDFSANVQKAAKKKMIGSKSLYDTVKEEQKYKPQAYLEHESAMTNEKANASVHGAATLPMSSLNKIAAVVMRHKIAVCESITAAVISRCKAAGFGGRLEWIGIPYTSTTGHSIVIARRQGELGKVKTWGNDFFFIDMWYYNLGMRPEYLIDGNGRAAYYNSDIAAKAGQLKVMADIT